MAKTALSYVVRIAFVDPAGMEAFLGWLRDHHAADVCAAGALSAELTRLDAQDAHVVEARYRFDSRAAFAAYERDHAPRLRAEGLAELARLGTAATFTRETGEVVLSLSR